jgi:RNA polymerase sigma factor (sigma-70 family)
MNEDTNPAINLTGCPGCHHASPCKCYPCTCRCGWCMLDCLAVYSPTVYRLLLRKYPPHIAEEAHSMAILSAVEAIMDGRAGRITSHKAHLYRVAVNNAIRLLKDQVGMSYSSDIEFVPRTANPLLSALIADMIAELDALSETQRKVLRHRYLEGMTVREAAKAIDRSIGSVCTAEKRGIKALRAALLYLLPPALLRIFFRSREQSTLY